MAKLGITKNASSRISHEVKNHPDLADNKWLKGDKVFEIKDPSQRLITMIGAGFFNEPRYYDKSDSSEFTLSDQANEIISTAMAVAVSSNPRDLWVISRWAREELHMRTTPNILAAVGCHMNETKQWARKYLLSLARRGDEPVQIFSAYLALFGKPLPNSLKRGLADVISKFSEWQILRYSSQSGHPNMKDLLSMIDRRRDWPVKKELFEYIFNGIILDPEATPIAAARKTLATKGNKFDVEAMDLILKGAIPWEVVVSQFGSKKEVWEFMVKNNLLGYMALLRNLRNLERMDVDDETKRIARGKLIEEARESKQLPFRFIAARNNVSENWTASAIDLALEETLENVDELPGKTAVFVDVSGSMYAEISQKSSMSCVNVASALGAIIAKKSGAENVGLFPFAKTFKKLQFSSADSTMNIINRIMNTNVGHATYAHLPMRYITDKKEKYDRIILLSDMQCYSESNLYVLNASSALGEALKLYQHKVNPKVFFHSIDLQGYGNSKVDTKDKRVHLLGGWSENVFNLIKTFEGIEEGISVPTIEELRKRY
jgi:hypothetical protein